MPINTHTALCGFFHYQSVHQFQNVSFRNRKIVHFISTTYLAISVNSTSLFMNCYTNIQHACNVFGNINSSITVVFDKFLRFFIRSFCRGIQGTTFWQHSNSKPKRGTHTYQPLSPLDAPAGRYRHNVPNPGFRANDLQRGCMKSSGEVHVNIKREEEKSTMQSRHNTTNFLHNT